MRTLVCSALPVLILLAGSCSDDEGDTATPAGSASAKTGFVIWAGGWQEGGSIVYDVDVMLMEIPEVIPLVTMNGQPTEDMDVEEGIYWDWDFPNGTAGQTITYSIRMGADVLSGTITFPPPIASVTCNGVALTNDQSTQVDSAGSYTFQWSPVSPASSYFLSLDAGENEYFYNKHYTGTSYTFTPTAPFYSIYLNISVAGSPGITAGSTPTVSSETMFAYVIVEGPEFYCTVQPDPQHVMKALLGAATPSEPGERASNARRVALLRSAGLM